MMQPGVYVDKGNLLVNELNELSVKEREKVFEEIHGVATIQEETPELLTESLMAFKTKLNEIPKRKRKAMDRAFFLRPSLEKDEKFQLMFLRAERFDAGQAALRMARYFDHKLELFGEEKLAKPITLDDLSQEEDLNVLESAAFQEIAQRDRSGRVVSFHHAKSFRLKNAKNFVSK